MAAPACLLAVPLWPGFAACLQLSVASLPHLLTPRFSWPMTTLHGSPSLPPCSSSGPTCASASSTVCGCSGAAAPKPTSPLMPWRRRGQQCARFGEPSIATGLGRAETSPGWSLPTASGSGVGGTLHLTWMCVRTGGHIAACSVLSRGDGCSCACLLMPLCLLLLLGLRLLPAPEPVACPCACRACCQEWFCPTGRVGGCSGSRRVLCMAACLAAL